MYLKTGWVLNWPWRLCDLKQVPCVVATTVQYLSQTFFFLAKNGTSVHLTLETLKVRQANTNRDSIRNIRTAFLSMFVIVMSKVNEKIFGSGTSLVIQKATGLWFGLSARLERVRLNSSRGKKRCSRGRGNSECLQFKLFWQPKLGRGYAKENSSLHRIAAFLQRTDYMIPGKFELW